MNAILCIPLNYIVRYVAACIILRYMYSCVYSCLSAALYYVKLIQMMGVSIYTK